MVQVKPQRVLLWLVALSVMFLPVRELSAEIWLEPKNGDGGIEFELPSFAPIIEKLGKAVVNISIRGEESQPKRGRRQQQAPGEQIDPFDFFFQVPPGQKRQFSSLGSGFVIHPDGYLVTNYHVVQKAERITVTFQDDKHEYEAELIGSDSKTDVALLKLKKSPKNLEAVVLGNSSNLKPGDWVIAIGNPFRLGHTATTGIVSALGRKVPGGGPYDDFIQTDASINPGNSGGPLFNAKGEVIGINTAIYSPGRFGMGGFNIGIGFAIPIDLVKDIISQLHKQGKVTRGWLGVLIQPVTEDVAEAFNLKKTNGALVADVMENSPASEAGIKRGDVILEYDGQSVQENDQLPLMVAQTPVNKEVELKIFRSGSEKTVDVKIKELVDGVIPEVEEAAEADELGATIQELTPELAASLGISDVSGVVVSAVAPDSPAAEAGLNRGDIIIEVGQKPVNSVADFKKAVSKLEKDKPLLMLVRRGENTVFLTLKKTD